MRFPPYLCTEKPHPENIERLPLHILRTHVDDALQPKTGAHGGGGDTVLTSPCLSNDALLPKSLGEQGLRHGIVDLVGTSVVKVLPLEVDERACAIGALVVLRQALRKVEGALTSNIVLENTVKFFLWKA